MRLRPAVTSASVVSKIATSTPARATTSAMPAPICPAPTTPTRSTRLTPSCATVFLSFHPRPDAKAPKMRTKRGLLRLLAASVSASVELSLLGGTGQRGGRGGGVHGGGDPVEVAGTDLALVAGGGVAALLGGELALLKLDVGAHLVAGIPVGQVEHRVVQRVEAGQGDELELET